MRDFLIDEFYHYGRHIFCDWVLFVPCIVEIVKSDQSDLT